MNGQTGMPISKPWLVVHQDDDGKIITILAGRPGAKYQEFGLAVADAVRHIARCFNISEHDVMRIVDRELENQTTEISGGRLP